MRRWKLVVVLVLGVLYMLACDEQARKQAAEAEADSPVAGVWYVQSMGDDQAMDPGVDVSFDFRGEGAAVYERRPSWPDQPVRFDLRYNLAGGIISIDSNELDPSIPRITGQVKLSEDGEQFEILTHNDRRWVLTREATMRAQTAAVETAE